MNPTVKWVGIIFLVGLVIAIASGYRGGAKSATSNYHSVMTGGGK
jgi:hypothetical protein